MVKRRRTQPPLGACTQPERYHDVPLRRNSGPYEIPFYFSYLCSLLWGESADSGYLGRILLNPFFTILLKKRPEQRILQIATAAGDLERVTVDTIDTGRA